MSRDTRNALILGLTVSVLLLSSTAFGQATGLCVKYFKSNTCPPCRLFERAYQFDKAFASWLNSNFDVQSAIHSSRNPQLVAQW